MLKLKRIRYGNITFDLGDASTSTVLSHSSSAPELSTSNIAETDLDTAQQVEIQIEPIAHRLRSSNKPVG